MYAQSIAQAGAILARKNPPNPNTMQSAQPPNMLITTGILCFVRDAAFVQLKFGLFKLRNNPKSENVGI